MGRVLRGQQQFRGLHFSIFAAAGGGGPPPAPPSIVDVLGSRVKRLYGDGGTNAAWTDVNAVQDAVQATAAMRPTVTATPASRLSMTYVGGPGFGGNRDMLQAPAAGASATPRYSLIHLALKCTDPGRSGETSFPILYCMSDNNGFYAYFDPTDMHVSALSDSVDVNCGSIADGNWHIVVALIDQVAGSMSVYRDNVLMGTATGGFTYVELNLGTRALGVGSYDASEDYSYSGTICEVGIAQSATTPFSSTDAEDVYDAIYYYING